MKAIRYIQQYNEVRMGTSLPKYKAGEVYAVTEETKRHVATGAAEQVDVDKGTPLSTPFGDKAPDVVGDNPDIVAAPAATPAPTPAPTPEPTPAPTPAPTPTPQQ